MNLLAVDPGPSRSGFLLFDAQTCHILGSDREVPNNELMGVLRVTACQVLVIEMVESFGMPVGRSVFETVFWIGRFAEAYQSTHSAGQLFRIGRQEVKVHLCRSVRAKDSNIRQTLIDRFGPPGTKREPGATYGVSGHGWSALALAVTCYETRISGSKKLPEEVPF